MMLVAMKVRKPDNRQTHTKPLSVVVDSASQSAARLDAVESIADMLLRNGDWVACVRSEKCKPVRNKVHIDSKQIESDRFRIRFTSVEKTEGNNIEQTAQRRFMECAQSLWSYELAERYGWSSRTKCHDSSRTIGITFSNSSACWPLTLTYKAPATTSGVIHLRTDETIPLPDWKHALIPLGKSMLQRIIDTWYEQNAIRSVCFYEGNNMILEVNRDSVARMTKCYKDFARRDESNRRFILNRRETTRYVEVPPDVLQWGPAHGRRQILAPESRILVAVPAIGKS